jgi:hypothetical protein
VGRFGVPTADQFFAYTGDFMPVKAAQDTDFETRLETIMAAAGARDRVNIEKHLAICDAEPTSDHASLWRRLMVILGGLAPLPLRTAGSQVMQFFVADGKYRMQVFALEDHCDGMITVYLPNVLTAAVRENIIKKTGEGYTPANAPKQILTIQQMDSTHPSDPPVYVKHMMGWNRKAVKLTLPIAAGNGPQIEAAEQLCALAAKQWAATPA